MIFPITFLLFISSLFTVIDGGYKIRYDINSPDKVFKLPPILNEISGLTEIDNNHIACTQDELGIIFF